MNDIQKARDVLAFWRMDSTPGPWGVSNSGNWVTSDADDIARALGDSPLIAGTAGNPELLDAIDAVLNAALVFNRDDGLRVHGRHIAAAVISADERMQQ